MSVFSAVTIVKGDATSMSYVPQRITSDGVAIYNSDAGVIAARSAFSIQLKEVQKTGVNRVAMRLSIPRVVSGTDPVTSLPILNVLPNPDLATASFALSRKGTKEERRDIRVQLANWLLSDAAVDAIDNGNAVRG